LRKFFTSRARHAAAPEDVPASFLGKCRLRPAPENRKMDERAKKRGFPLPRKDLSLHYTVPQASWRWRFFYGRIFIRSKNSSAPLPERHRGNPRHAGTNSCRFLRTVQDFPENLSLRRKISLTAAPEDEARKRRISAEAKARMPGKAAGQNFLRMYIGSGRPSGKKIDRDARGEPDGKNGFPGF
jgi:hypothetical protein